MRTVLVSLLIVFMILAMSCGKDEVGPVISGDTTHPTFASIQTTVFTPSCATSSCHGGRERPTLSDGAAYNNIVNISSSQNVLYIVPGDPDASYLYRKLIGSSISGGIMPVGLSMPKTKIDSIRVWIELGARR